MGKTRGFTLIELVIVIAIIGILASLAIPKFIDVSQEAKIAKAKGMLGAIRTALATRYAASATGGASASYPNTLAATDFAGGGSGAGVPPLMNPINARGDAQALTATTTGLATSPSHGYWFVSLSSSADYGKAGVYSDGLIDTSNW